MSKILTNEEIKDLFKGRKKIPVYEVVKDWDCDFSFSNSEILIWYKVDFYIFLYGRYAHSGNSLVNKDFYIGWRSTNLFKEGLEKIYVKVKKLTDNKAYVDKQRKLMPRWIEKHQEVQDYPYLEEIETNFRRSKIFIGGKEYPVKIPVRVKTSRYRPRPGFNPIFKARKYPYKYTLDSRTYVFGWARSKNFIDVTDVFKGIADWPAHIEYIHFDLNIPLESIGAYPFLIYLIRNNLKYATFKRYVDYISKRITG